MAKHVNLAANRSAIDASGMKVAQVISRKFKRFSPNAIS